MVAIRRPKVLKYFKEFCKEVCSCCHGDGVIIMLPALAHRSSKNKGISLVVPLLLGA